jgi:hypothetical protein
MDEAADALEAAEAELTRRDTVTDEAVEAAARAMALVDEDDGCFERLDLWNATAPGDRWQVEEPQSYDEEATVWWRKRARAALAAAPVSLEAAKAETTTEWAQADADRSGVPVTVVQQLHDAGWAYVLNLAGVPAWIQPSPAALSTLRRRPVSGAGDDRG